MSFELAGILFSIAVVAGLVDSMAGGGGLITVPALLAVGLPPAQALATNKLQSVGGAFSASLYFVSKGLVKLKDLKLAIALTFVGSMIGTLLVQTMDASVLSHLIPFLLLGMACYFIFSPNIGDEDNRQRISMPLFSCSAAMLVGFYDGFFGAGHWFLFYHCLCQSARLFPDSGYRSYQGVELHQQCGLPVVFYYWWQSCLECGRCDDRWPVFGCAAGFYVGSE